MTDILAPSEINYRLLQGKNDEQRTHLKNRPETAGDPVVRRSPCMRLLEYIPLTLD